MKQYIKKLIFKPFKEGHKQYTLVAEYGIHTTNWTYFYATCLVYKGLVTESNIESKGQYLVGAGRCNEEDFPELKDIIELSLSDIQGIPLHSLENGWYYLSNRSKITTMNHFRIDESIYKELVEKCGTKNKLAEWVETQKVRWMKEAQYVINKYELK